MPTTSLTPALIARFETLWRSGLIAKLIQHELGMTIDQIQYWRDKLDLPKRVGQRRVGQKKELVRFNVWKEVNDMLKLQAKMAGMKKNQYLLQVLTPLQDRSPSSLQVPQPGGGEGLSDSEPGS